MKQTRSLQPKGAGSVPGLRVRYPGGDLGGTLTCLTATPSHSHRRQTATASTEQGILQ